MQRWLTPGMSQSEVICITAYGKFFTGVTPQKACGQWADFYPYGIKLVSCYHALGLLDERTTPIWNKSQNLETVSGSFRPWSIWLGHFGHFLVVTTLIDGSFRPDFEVGRWALSRLVKTMLVVFYFHEHRVRRGKTHPLRNLAHRNFKC